ncbi:MAG: LysR family transcriptional regulator [Oceanospirillaceae bacterium]|nr:LysR family transcriptional regulator [Oceanospirillaceae bacterium]MBT11886.1 LysR family transcriptional regulator [Oceanospirillaceae bacterium]|tara:strand:- start:265 stop:1149 length:885 start_codon:yes stop_codon:yes gene_type:complete
MESFEGLVEFVAVAERRGFTAAAKHLKCSTSHVSRQISKLEERLGSALLVRSTRQVNLTPNGAIYYQHAKDLLIGLQQANEQVNQEQVKLTGTLRVSAAGGFAEYHLAPALMQFAQNHADLTIDIDFNSRFVNFIDDDVDFAIRYGELSDSSLIARKLLSRSMMAVASAGYLQQHGEPTHPDHLKDHHCIISNNDTWKFSDGEESCSVKVKGRWSSNNTNVILKACEQGFGIAYLPQDNFITAIENGRLVPVLQPYWGTGASSWIVYQDKRFMPLRTRMAIDFLLEYFAGWDEK